MLLKRIDHLKWRGNENQDHLSKRNLLSCDIINEPLLEYFKMPTINPYQRDNNPYDHLDAFNVQRNLLTMNDNVRCKCFLVTLEEAPWRWIRKFLDESIIYNKLWVVSRIVPIALSSLKEVPCAFVPYGNHFSKERRIVEGLYSSFLVGCKINNKFILILQMHKSFYWV